MRVDITTEGIDRVLGQFLATERQYDAAAIRAINKTRRWAEGQILRAVATESGVASGRLRQRRVFRNDARRGTPRARLWFGLNPLKAAYAGRLRQTRRGAYAGQHFFARAFVARMASGHEGIYRRAGKKRLPLIEETVELRRADRAIRAVASEIPQRLLTVLRQELNYETTVKPARSKAYGV